MTLTHRSNSRDKEERDFEKKMDSSLSFNIDNPNHPNLNIFQDNEAINRVVTLPQA